MRGFRSRRWMPILFATFLLALDIAFHGPPETGFQDIAEAVTWVPTPEELVCRSCHTGGADQTVADAHHLLPQTEDGCYRCHGYSNIDGIISIPVHRDCTFCHGALNHAQDHDHLGTSPNCSTCHRSGSFAEVLDVHLNACATCHSSSLPAVIQAIADGRNGIATVNCETCHGAGYNHPTAQHTKVSGVDKCVVCHVGNLIASIHKSNCLACHTSARPQVVQAVSTRNGGTCETCHVAGHVATVNLSTLHDLGGSCSYCHNMHGGLMPHYDLDGSANCGTCHTATSSADILNIHLDDCLRCHLASAADKLTVLLAAWAAPSGMKTNCESCHGSGYSHPTAQ